jgi:hypothetical protein
MKKVAIAQVLDEYGQVVNSDNLMGTRSSASVPSVMIKINKTDVFLSGIQGTPFQEGVAVLDDLRLVAEPGSYVLALESENIEPSSVLVCTEGMSPCWCHDTLQRPLQAGTTCSHCLLSLNPCKSLHTISMLFLCRSMSAVVIQGRYTQTPAVLYAPMGPFPSTQSQQTPSAAIVHSMPCAWAPTCLHHWLATTMAPWSLRTLRGVPAAVTSLMNAVY